MHHTQDERMVISGTRKLRYGSVTGQNDTLVSPSTQSLSGRYTFVAAC